MGILRSGGMPTERSGLAGAARSLAAFRLAGVKDSPADIPLGAYGDEFEYRDRAAFATVWVPQNSLPDADWHLAGSGVRIAHPTSDKGRGFLFDTGGSLPADFEIAVLVSGLAGGGYMWGPSIVDASGNGIGASMYNDGLGVYFWGVASLQYGSTLGHGGGLTAAQMIAPHWYAIRRSSSTTWRLRTSPDGATWTTCVAAETYTVSGARYIFIGNLYNGSGLPGAPVIHRLVYGTADLGL